MEDISCSKKRRKKRRKAKDVKNLKPDQEIPLKSKGVMKAVSEVKKLNQKKVRRQAEHYLGTLIQDFCTERDSHPGSQDEQYKYRQWKVKDYKEIVDLSENDSLVNNPNTSVVLVSSFEVESQNKSVIDLSDSVPERKEVIDLTESIIASQDIHISKDNGEPAVIDISEEDSKEMQNVKMENDDVFVIGTFSKSCHFSNKLNDSCIRWKSKLKNINNISCCSDKLKRKYAKKQSVLDKISKKSTSHSREVSLKPKEASCSSKVAKIGENIYVNSPVTLPSSGLRPIIIDGSNVAYVHSNSNFSCKRLQICINYFKEKGHKVTAFVPQFRLNSNKSDDPLLLKKLERQGDVVLTPSKRIDGKNIVPYDDRFIVQTAVLKGGIIVTKDNYTDLLRENPAWAETIKYRCLSFIWVDDMLMFPKDPLGEYGPSLQEFLRFH